MLRTVQLERRQFIGLTAGACLSTACATARPQDPRSEPADRWAAVRAEFEQDPAYANFTGFLLTSHPRPVREAIARYRDALDRNPVMVLEEQLALTISGGDSLDQAPRTAAAKFLNVAPDEIALTDSTTMGLGLVYGGFKLARGQEILTTSHGHYSTHEALRLRAQRDGIQVRTIDLYAESAKVSEAEVVAQLTAGLSPQTRVVGVTWVHSSTGVKMPIRAIANVIAQANQQRGETDRIRLVVDGVHGMGIENFTIPELGCDVFVAGCHKWLFGPRGTGFVWARAEVWSEIMPTIPAFEGPPFGAWLRGEVPRGPGGIMNTPGGFHSFEHRWALPEAFAFQTAIGRADIAARVHELNTQLKQGLLQQSRVRVHTPIAQEWSSGITCFDVEGVPHERVVEHLLKEKIIGSVSPYRVSHVRLAPGLLNTPEQVDDALASLASL